MFLEHIGISFKFTTFGFKNVFVFLLGGGQKFEKLPLIRVVEAVEAIMQYAS